MAVRMAILDRHPFWGHLLLHMRLVPAPELPALAATDCVRRIWYNPLFSRHLSVESLGFVLLHEVSHQVFASADRARGRDHRLWNAATDYAINRTVAAIRAPDDPRRPLYPPPRGTIPGLGEVDVLLDNRYAGLVAEVIYEHLVPKELPPMRRIEVRLGPGHTLPGVLDHGGGVDIHLPDSLSSEERDELGDRLREAVRSAAALGERGDVPAGFERLLEAPRGGRLPWRALLERIVNGALVPANYSYRRPNRRYWVDGLVVPGLVNEAAPEVVVALDTSASMRAASLNRAAAELAGLLEAVPRVTLAVADARVHEVVPPSGMREWLMQRRAKGGGGTDHRPVFEWIAAARREPDIFIGITDLDSRFPSRAPRYPVLWLTPPEHGPVPFGTAVAMGEG